MMLRVILAILFCAQCMGANKYVRAGASGANNGTDWNNAYTALPSSLTRGDTYYVADGTYGAYTFDDAATSGASTPIIRIWKATVADHGTDTGWLDSYGDGEAVWTHNSQTIWQFGPDAETSTEYGYIEIDGKFGEGRDPGGYGFRVYIGTQARGSAFLSGVSYGLTAGVNNITIKHVEWDLDNGGAAITADTSNAFGCYSIVHNLTIYSCYIHHSTGLGIVVREGDGPWSSRSINNVTIERTHFYRNGGGGDTAEAHWELTWLTGINNLIFRYNTIEDTLGPVSGQTGIIMVGACTDTYIYGNLFFTNPDFASAEVGNHGIIGTWSQNDYKMTNVFIYNNTFVNMHNGAGAKLFFDHDSADDVNVVAKNNLYYNPSFSWFGIDTHSHNAVGGGQSSAGTSAQTGITTAIFMDYDAEDFRLASDTTAGDTTIDAAFRTDRYGNTGSSRGAFQFVDEEPPPAASLDTKISNVRFGGNVRVN